MKTFVLSETLFNKIMGVVTTLPWGQVNPIMAEVQKEIGPQLQPAPSPVPEAPAAAAEKVEG